MLVQRSVVLPRAVVNVCVAAVRNVEPMNAVFLESDMCSSLYSGSSLPLSLCSSLLKLLIPLMAILTALTLPPTLRMSATVFPSCTVFHLSSPVSMSS